MSNETLKKKLNCKFLLDINKKLGKKRVLSKVSIFFVLKYRFILFLTKLKSFTYDGFINEKPDIVQ